MVAHLCQHIFQVSINGQRQGPFLASETKWSQSTGTHQFSNLVGIDKQIDIWGQAVFGHSSNWVDIFMQTYSKLYL